ncbi:MAG: hypothetical protein K8F58_19725, partial [Bauldia sp.]|nr:hypothetical protein [Bauldia sp.]
MEFDAPPATWPPGFSTPGSSVVMLVSGASAHVRKWWKSRRFVVKNTAYRREKTGDKTASVTLYLVFCPMIDTTY